MSSLFLISSSPAAQSKAIATVLILYPVRTQVHDQACIADSGIRKLVGVPSSEISEMAHTEAHFETQSWITTAAEQLAPNWSFSARARRIGLRSV